MNTVFLIGRLTKDVELRYIASTGKAVARFTLAVDRAFAKKEDEVTADFFNIVVWGKTAENCANYLAKGRMLAVRGRLQNNNYTDKSGVKQYAVEIIAEEVKFIDWGDKKGKQEQANTDFNSLDESGYRAINDDETPF